MTLTWGEVFRRVFALLVRSMETGNFFVACLFLFAVFAIWELPAAAKAQFLLDVANTKAVALSGWVAFAVVLYLFRSQMRSREQMHRSETERLRGERDEAVRGQLKLPFPAPDNPEERP
ncbi:MAG: hypothetical protein ACREIA_26970 [Opitutaceae bacterium]